MNELLLIEKLKNNSYEELASLIVNNECKISIFNSAKEEFVSAFEIRLESLEDNLGRLDRRTQGLSKTLANLTPLNEDVIICLLNCNSKEYTFYFSSDKKDFLGSIEW